MKSYKVIVLLGNFGVGKSTILKKLHDENGLKEPFFCAIKESITSGGINTQLPNCYILGSNPIGADSISNEKKEVARLKVADRNGNVFIAGVYYTSEVDFEYYIRCGLIPVFVHLKNSKRENIARMKKRGGARFNEATWASNENKFVKLREYADKRGLRFYTIDNDQQEQTVFEEFLEVMNQIDFN